MDSSPCLSRKKSFYITFVSKFQKDLLENAAMWKSFCNNSVISNPIELELNTCLTAHTIIQISLKLSMETLRGHKSVANNPIEPNFTFLSH